LILFIIFYLGSLASDIKIPKDSTVVIIQLNKGSAACDKIDSVYLIFDKSDGSGAGIIRQIFYPVDNEIKISVPKGKYFVNIVCVGEYDREYFDRRIKAKRNKQNKLLLKLREPALFTQGYAYIPEEKIDPANLSITKYSFYR